MKDYKLAESEYRFMKIVWETQPLTSANLVKLCAEKLGWKKSTTYTVLKRLAEKEIRQERCAERNELPGRCNDD